MPDIPYKRDPARRKYLSISKHMRQALNGYSKWVHVKIERRTFDNADYGLLDGKGSGNAWLDVKGNLWGFITGFAEVGTKREQFGFFEDPVNPVLEWHGFPIIPFSEKRYEICDELLTRWVEEELIDPDDIPQLKKGRKI